MTEWPADETVKCAAETLLALGVSPTARIIEQRARQEKVWALIHHSSDPDFYRGRAAVDGGEAD